MFIVSHGYRIVQLFAFILLLNHGIAIIPLSELTISTNVCANISIQNVSFGEIHSLNFYAGQSQPPNVSCSWTIINPSSSKWSNYILSLRVIELENDPTHWSNELTLWTGSRQISVDDINKRTFLISSSSSIQVFFRTKPPLLQTYNPYIRTNLRVRRFLIEFIHVNNDVTTNVDERYFRCLSSGIIIPKQWKCNCIFECSYEDYSDEDNCLLCSMYEPSSSLLCQPNEIWCLPNPSKSLFDSLLDLEYEEDEWMLSHINHSRNIDPKGVCVPREEFHECLYSTSLSKCERVLAWKQDHGQMLLNAATLNTYETLCFVIIAKDGFRIKLIVDQHQLIEQRPDLELAVYDGSEHQSRVLSSFNRLTSKSTLQTREHSVATIIIRKISAQAVPSAVNQPDVDDVFKFLENTERKIVRRDTSSILVNITWFISFCPDDQKLCSGHFETKCYTKQQRCDGIWDCISGDDELGCSPELCPTTFACSDKIRLTSDQPACFTWSERCNGNAFCANRTDEKFCSHWWCNSNNGTFLCRNLNCIYETWVCDGTDDCGDHSDEMDCPSRLPRRIVTAAVIGATVCSTLFIIALGCTCKLFHLRTAERRAASRLLDPNRYIEQRRQDIQREQEQRAHRLNSHPVATSTDSLLGVSSETRRIAPPSYNQTMGLVDENEERQAALAEHLRLAGLSNYISLPPVHSSVRVSRSASRHRHRRHRRHRHHHHRRTHSEGSRVALLEPTVVVPQNAFPLPSTSFPSNRFHRLRSQFRSLFSTNRPTVSTPINENRNNPNNSILNYSISNQYDVYERQNPPNSVQPIVLNSRSYLHSDFIQPRELPPPYVEEQSVSSNQTVNSTSTAVTNSRRNSSAGSDLESTNSSTAISSSYRIRKRQMPANTLRDRMRQLIVNSAVRATTDDANCSTQPIATTLDIDFEEQPSIVSIKNDEQECSDDDKMLTT